MSKSSSANSLATKVGGRLVEPALPIVDPAGPTAVEKSFDKSLTGYYKDNIPLEDVDGIQRRERVLNRMGTLCREWIQSVCMKRNLPKAVMAAAGGQLFTSGSYRLGVHEPGADIDTILVAPNICTREDFFGSSNVSEEDLAEGKRDPNSLAERIRHHADVTNFVPVEGAAVPILTFDWEGVNIDFLFARLNSPSVPADFDIDNDAVLDGVDSATEKSLNGPRVTNLIAALVSGTPERYQVFLSVVRCVRKWAKARGLYANKMGYWGGVNINMAVALCIQLYPNACAVSLLRKFFLVFRTWRWPNPVMLTKPHDAGYGLQVWSPQAHNARQVAAPMITPAYPAMNSTLAVSRQTLQIMHEEFVRGHEIVDGLWKEHQASGGKGELDWGELFRPSDFFFAYPHYLSLCIVGPTQTDAQAWVGFVESRLRKLVSDMLSRSLPLSKIQLWPKKLEACIADRSALLTMAQRRNSVTYMIGFQVDKMRMRGNQLNVEQQMAKFRQFELARFQPLLDGMDILCKTFNCKQLPKLCFQIYDGGKDAAMKRRREIRNADPKRQERRRKRKLDELKAKMADIQKKKEEKEAAAKEEGRKRKRGDVADLEEEEEEIQSKMIKTEQQEAVEEPPSSDDVVKEEENGDVDQLESALDTILESETGKTREEAEAERQQLLAADNEATEEVQEEDYEVSDDEEGYAGDDARQVFMPKHTKLKGQHTDIRSLPLGEEEADILRKIGYTIVSDVETETKVVGGNLPSPFVKFQKDVNAPHIDDAAIKFKTKFDIVELDANGHVIDQGDEDFSPSKTWIGRKAGFEFKLGERGLGYYRTGKKVVVPSNMAY